MRKALTWVAPRSKGEAATGDRGAGAVSLMVTGSSPTPAASALCERGAATWPAVSVTVAPPTGEAVAAPCRGSTAGRTELGRTSTGTSTTRSTDGSTAGVCGTNLGAGLRIRSGDTESGANPPARETPLNMSNHGINANRVFNRFARKPRPSLGSKTVSPRHMAAEADLVNC